MSCRGSFLFSLLSSAHSWRRCSPGLGAARDESKATGRATISAWDVVLAKALTARTEVLFVSPPGRELVCTILLSCFCVPLHAIRPRLVALLLAPALALTTLCVTTPAQAQKIPPSFFGLHDKRLDHGADRHRRRRELHHHRDLLAQRRDREGPVRLDPPRPAGRSGRERARQADGPVGAVPAVPIVEAGLPQLHRLHAEYQRVEDVRLEGRQALRPTVDYQIWPEPNIIQNWKGTTPRWLSSPRWPPRRSTSMPARRCGSVSCRRLENAR